MAIQINLRKLSINLIGEKTTAASQSPLSLSTHLLAMRHLAVVPNWLSATPAVQVFIIISGAGLLVEIS